MNDINWIDSVHNNLLSKYNDLGEDIVYEGTKLCKMSDRKIESEIHYILNSINKYFNITNSAWIIILNDILTNRRRKRKLNKLINNIK